METKTVQLIGHPKDGRMEEVSAYELRGDESIFVPYVPQDATYDDIAYAEYKRFILGTQRGNLIFWINPVMPTTAFEQVVGNILDGNRTDEGVWFVKGTDMDGRLQLLPLSTMD